MAKTVYTHDTLIVSTMPVPKTVFVHNTLYTGVVTESSYDISNDFRTILIETGLYDINNDFRTLKISPIDFNNDFRFFGLGLYNFDNDFRMAGNIVKLDVDNDFRFGDYAFTNINNDFRMVGEIVLGNLNNDFRDRKEELLHINNKFNTSKVYTIDVNNKINSCIEVVKDINNISSWVKEVVLDVSCDFRTKKDTITDVNNDFRMLSPWQVPEAGEVGFQSAGKTEVKVYINTVEQTDINIDSITINQILNGSHIASFNLARAYDATKPTTNSNVEIKYKGILLYKGYITEVNPADSPESIRVSCQDEYWNLNKDKKYFFVGRKPVDTNEYYYETIGEALNGLEFSYGIGNFIPQTMDLYGSGIADAISNLVQNSGNFNWFIKPDGTKKLWQAGEGNIIDLEPQELEKNLGLYQVLKHNIRENISAIVNKLRVLMGNWTVRQNSEDISEGSGSKTYIFTYHTRHQVYAYPVWDSSLEILQKNSSDGYGYDNQNPNKDYKNVFRKFWLPSLNPKMESWSDRYPPLVETNWGSISSWNNLSEYKGEGFSLDYGFQVGYEYPLGASNIARPSITFSEPQIVYDIYNGECYRVRSKIVKLYLWKEHRVSYTINPQTDPDTAPVEDLDNPLMFYTDKMGSYSETIMGDLNLSGLSIQEGYILKDDEGNIIENIPSWNDTDFAKDSANWQLSKTCDKKYIGSIDLTIDTMLYYNIDLSKRIKINGVVNPINIMSIIYNFNNFTATLNLESNREFRRTISIPYHGE